MWLRYRIDCMPYYKSKPDWPWYLNRYERVIVVGEGRKPFRGEIVKCGNAPDTWIIIRDDNNKRVEVQGADCLDEYAEIQAGRAKPVNADNPRAPTHRITKT